MSKDIFPVGDLIKAGIERVGLKGAIREKAALSLWKEVVGEKTASVTIPEKVLEGILFVSCRDSMWAQQLHFLRPVIIEKLNERLGGKVIKEIRLSGRGYRKNESLEEEQAFREKTYKKAELDKDELRKIEEAVARIENRELAEKVKKSLIAGRALRRSLERDGTDQK